MLLEYIRAAMAGASIVQPVAGRPYAGSIPALAGVRSVAAATPEECREKLQLSLGRWLSQEISRNNPLPAIGGVTFAVAGMAEKFNALGWLERDIRALEKLAASRRGRVEAAVRRAPKFALANWTFVATLLGALIAGAAYYKYGVNSYLEGVLTLYNNKQAAAKYSRMGDDLMERGEWDAAKDAYGTALKLDPNNTDAISATYIVSIYQPTTAGEFYYEVLDAKLSAARKIIEGDRNLGKYLYLINYFEGVRHEQKKEFDLARKSLELSKANANFVEGDFALANVELTDGAHVEAAISLLERAVTTSPGFTRAHNNLGSCYILKGQFEQARRHLEQAAAQAPFLETLIHLGDVYLLTRDPEKALKLHRKALKLAESAGDRKSRYLGGSTYNFLPTSPTDAETPKRVVKATSTEEHKMWINFGLGLDYALLDRDAGQQAEEAFAAALAVAEAKNDPEANKDFKAYFANKIDFIIRHLDPSAEKRARLEEYRLRLQPGKEKQP